MSDFGKRLIKVAKEARQIALEMQKRKEHMTWKPTTYETIGNPDGGFTVSGWMIRRGNAGNTRDHADSIFVPMKWTAEPPAAILEIVEALNGVRVEERIVA